MIRIALILIIYLIQRFEANGPYNDKWISYYSKINMNLIDSLIILPNQLDTLIIPTPIIKNQHFSFNSIEKDITGKLELERINYTDIKYTLSINDIKESVIATLNPSFHIGTETKSFENDEYWLYEYFITENTDNCVIKLGIMTESLTEKKIKPIIIVTVNKSFSVISNELVFR